LGFYPILFPTGHAVLKGRKGFKYILGAGLAQSLWSSVRRDSCVHVSVAGSVRGVEKVVKKRETE